jgi:hypothetical protein
MIPITDFDIVFISYDEPNANELFECLKEVSPRAPLHSHGVKGFEESHREAAKLAKTDRFISVDGDNIVRKSFFDLSIEDGPKDVVYSYQAQNVVNGLFYGNGGIKIWPRDLVINNKIHSVDTIWHYRYWLLSDIVSDVYYAESPYHAFRAGYREGVKLTLINGKNPDWKTTYELMGKRNIWCLSAWASIGADVLYGDWSIYGARCGLEHLWINNLDPDLVNDYAWFDEQWKKISLDDNNQMRQKSISLGQRLEKLLHLDLPNLTPDQSRWAKQLIINGSEPRIVGLLNPNMKPLTL